MSDFKLMQLPYDLKALEPHISKETLEFHWGKHHQTYVNNLNNLLKGTDMEGEQNLIKIITATKQGPIFNNAAQVYNHNFYWYCLSPNAGGEPTGKLLDAINERWGSYKTFREEFTKCAVSTFGSGWAWLVVSKEGKLEIVSTSNAVNPINNGEKPLLTCDVWEHAYYIDYRNARPKYVDAFWNLVNWKYVSENFQNPEVCQF